MYLCGHDQGASAGIYSDIPCHQANILEFFI